MSQTVDLFTGNVVAKPKRRKSGSRGSKLRELIPRQISGHCLHCGKTFNTLDEMCLPTLAGWAHYQCIIDMQEANRRAAVQVKRLMEKRAA